GAKALLAPTLPSTGHRSIAEALKRSAALYVELREAEPPSSPVKGMPGLLLDFIDGKQPRAWPSSRGLPPARRASCISARPTRPGPAGIARARLAAGSWCAS